MRLILGLNELRPSQHLATLRTLRHKALVWMHILLVKYRLLIPRLDFCRRNWNSRLRWKSNWVFRFKRLLLWNLFNFHLVLNPTRCFCCIEDIIRVIDMFPIKWVRWDTILSNKLLKWLLLICSCCYRWGGPTRTTTGCVLRRFSVVAPVRIKGWWLVLHLKVDVWTRVFQFWEFKQIILLEEVLNKRLFPRRIYHVVSDYVISLLRSHEFLLERHLLTLRWRLLPPVLSAGHDLLLLVPLDGNLNEGLLALGLDFLHNCVKEGLVCALFELTELLTLHDALRIHSNEVDAVPF